MSKRIDFLNLAQRVDFAAGFVALALAVYFLAAGSLVWGLASLAGSALSFASAKYVPARWLLRKMLLARTR